MISGRQLKEKGTIFLNDIFKSNHPIIITGIVAVILLIFVILSIYTQSKDNIVNEFQKHQLTSVESAARGIEGFIKEVIKDLCILSELKSGQDSELPIKQAALDNLYALHAKENGFLVSLFYFDQQGNLRLAAPALPGRGENLMAGYGRGKNPAGVNDVTKLHISRLFFNEKREGRIRVSVPVFYTDTSSGHERRKFLGILAADIDVKKMADHFLGHVNLGGSYVSILDADGTILEHPCPQFTGKSIKDIDIKRIDENNKVFPFQNNEDFLALLLGKSEGVLRVISPNLGRLELLSYAPIYLPVRSWIMTMFTPYSEISNPIGRLQKRFTLIMLALIILMTVGSVLLITVNNKRVKTEARVAHLTREIQLEEKIKKSEAKLRAILQSINDRIVILDPDLQVIWSNSKGSGEGLIGKKCYEIYRGLHQPCSKCVVKASFADGNSHLSEVIGVEKDQKFFYEICSSPILDHEGKVASVVEMTRDITKARKMDILIRESENRYRNLVEQMNEGLMVINHEGKITFVNQKFCEVLGYKHKEIAGQDYGIFLDAENQVRMKEAIEESKKNQALSFEMELANQQGEHLTLICSLSSLFDDRGDYRGASVVFTEITERRKLEREIQVNRDKLRAILKSLSDGVVIIDKNYTIQYMNESGRKIFGDQIQGVCYQALWNRTGPCDACVLEEVIERRQSLFLTKDSLKGQALDISISPVVMEDGTISLLKVFRDVTERKRLESQLLEFEQNRLRDLRERYRFGNIIGKNHKMQEIYELISIVSQGFTTVLIQGASGTGKELIARAIHYNSPQQDKPFIGVSCSALSDGLLESELFGHVRGSFTGAVRDKMGRFELADGGTLFLDEIGDISPMIQVKLLRVLQERQFERVGSLKTISVNVRVIAATNKDLKAAVARGEFREDLYYRLNVVSIFIPSLKERVDDIPLLVNHFIEHFNKKLNRNISSVSSSAMDCLISFDWPGNIRQLENTIEHAFICAKGKILMPEDFPIEIQKAKKKKKSESPTGTDLEQEEGEKVRTLDEMEARMIAHALQETGGHLGNTAQVLGIARSTLWRLMKKHGISKGAVKGADREDKVVSLEERFLNKKQG
ncbi:MAG: sigma 54-interacting transcriptional regulator [bacterium]